MFLELRTQARLASAAVAAMVVGLALAGCSARYSPAEGMRMINEGVAGLVASMDPRPSLPSPRDEGDAGACDGMDGDSDGGLDPL
jgi:hypothetical protein